MSLWHDEPMSTRSLYIFIDESGNLVFTPKSTEHFCLTALVCSPDRDLVSDFFFLRMRLLWQLKPTIDATDLEYFHASVDKQAVRDEVFALLNPIKDHEVYSVITQKRKAHPSLHDTQRYYYQHAKWLMHGILYGVPLQKYDDIMIFFDEMPVAKKKKAMLKGLKTEIASFFASRRIQIPYHIVSHSSKANIYQQLADYYSWAIYVKHERNEQRPYHHIAHSIKNIFDPFSKGTQYFY